MKSKIFSLNSFRRVVSLIPLCFFYHFCLSQQANKWYFGDHAGLNFSTSPPTPLLDGQINTHEGCSTVSDSLGNLLFYTDGVTVWNKNHQAMPNGTGLMGHESSTHSSIVIPKPGNSKIYFLFTADAAEPWLNGVGGYRLSEIDMTLNGGLGDITLMKNVLLYAPSTEKLTAASHANGTDVWVITKEWDNHVFRTYKITCNGFEPNPVISTVDPKNGSTLGYKSGCLKVSPDGKLLASARNLEGKFDLFQFDNSMGIISNRLMITQSNQIGIYGVEFSPNSKLVYFNGSYTFQYKVDVYDSAYIRSSQYQVDNVFIQHGALQLGPDNKIYSITYPNNSVIANPNQYGIGCNYQEQTISLGGRNGHAGYPTFFNRLVTNYNLDYTYSIQPNCESLNFSGVSNIPGNLMWNWDFGDGTTGTGQNINHVFPPTNNHFVVTLTVINPNVCGSNSTRSKTIVFNRIAPVADFSYQSNCGSKTVSFQNQSSVPSPGIISSYLWDFGDGNTSAAISPVYTYTSFGTYHVTLKAFSGDACNTVNTSIKSITIGPKPISDFNANDTCFTEAVQFQNTSTISSGSIISWSWTFGDGNTSSIQNPSHTYAQAGTYLVSLYTTASNNCVSDIVTKSVRVGAKPAVNFIVPSMCLLDGTATFANTTTISDGSVLGYNWSFGDPNATPANPNYSTQVNPTHLYSQASNYNVKLKVNSEFGCVDSLERLFTVNGALPKAKFNILNVNNICSYDTLIIKDSSSVDFGNITKIEINWGDGNLSVYNNPGQITNTHQYLHHYGSFSNPSTRTFLVTMRSYSGNICVDSYSRNVTIHASPEIRFDPISDICNNVSSINLNSAQVMWDLSGTGNYYGNGVVDGNSFNPSQVNHGDHAITYTFISSAGCRADSTRNVTVNPVPKSMFSASIGCLPSAKIQFTSNSLIASGNSGSLNHLWSFGDSLSSTQNPNTSTLLNPVHSYGTLDSFLVRLRTVSNKGCVHDTSKTLYPNTSIFSKPIVDFKIDSLPGICQGSPVFFIDQSILPSQSLSSVSWNFADGNSSNSFNPTHLFNTSGNFNVEYSIISDKGCRSDTISKSLQIHSVPAANFVFDSTCYGKPIHFNDRSSNIYGNISDWSWEFGDGVISTIQHPLHTYSSYQNYTVRLQVATSNGCMSNWVSKSIAVKPIKINAGTDTIVLKNQPFQLTASGASTYQWSPSFGLNNATIYNPIVILNSNQSYILKGITTEGCIGFDTINIKVFEKAEIYVPSGFTPNRDGLNDYLKPFLIGIKELKYFKVFDRNGSLIFQSKNSYDKWDGTIKGVQMNSQNFVWIAEGISFDGQIIMRKGNTVLIR